MAAGSATDTARTPCQTFLRNLLGVWEGAGKGEYPTMANFEYEARATYQRVPVKTKGYFINTTVETFKKGEKDKVGMHYEAGFMRCTGDNEVAWGLAHNFAGTESAVGAVNADGTIATFNSTSVGNVGKLTATERVVQVNPAAGVLRDDFAMATTEVSLAHHLTTKYIQHMCFPDGQA